MKQWPNTIPEDLRARLDGTLSMRGVDAASVWGDVVEWLRAHGVEPPDHPLPEYVTPRDRDGPDPGA